MRLRLRTAIEESMAGRRRPRPAVSREKLIESPVLVRRFAGIPQALAGRPAGRMEERERRDSLLAMRSTPRAASRGPERAAPKSALAGMPAVLEER
jgi:hypothetical protein